MNHHALFEQVIRQLEPKGVDPGRIILFVIRKLDAIGPTFDFVRSGEVNAWVKMTQAGETLVARLLRFENAALVILCPLDAEGNCPPPGHSWDREHQLKATELACFSLTVMVTRHHETLNIVANRRDRVVFYGFVEDGRVEELKGAADRIRDRIRQSLTS